MENEQTVLDKITLPEFSEEQILPLIKEQGVVIIPNFLDAERLNSLNEEFNKIITDVPGGKHIPGCTDKKLDKGAVVSLDRAAAKESDLPVTLNIFSDPRMESLKTGYLNEKASFNDIIYVCHDVVGTRHEANDLHFDVVPTFKFFIYLTDTTIENGAFSCIPGTNVDTQAVREKYGKKISYKNRALSRIPERESEAIPIEGKAGTLIIFTTEVWHKAGTVSAGERKVMRGHCRTSENQTNPLLKLLIKLRSK